MSLSPSAPGAALPFTLTPTLTATTLLSSVDAADLRHRRGARQRNRRRADRIGRAGAEYRRQVLLSRAVRTTSIQRRTRPIRTTRASTRKAIRVSNDGKSVFVSDEYGPYVYQFDRATGQRHQSVHAAGQPRSRPTWRARRHGDQRQHRRPRRQQGHGRTRHHARRQDAGRHHAGGAAPGRQDTNKLVRIVTIDIATGATHEYAYKLTDGIGRQRDRRDQRPRVPGRRARRQRSGLRQRCPGQETVQDRPGRRARDIRPDQRGGGRGGCEQDAVPGPQTGAERFRSRRYRVPGQNRGARLRSGRVAER